MLVALTVRKLKQGAFEEFKKAWEGDSPDEAPEGWVKAYTVQNVNDENEVVSFGFFDGTLEELRKSQQDLDYEGERAKMDDFIESTGADGIYEVVFEMGD
jgi:heme-degrading monooxygenase HmoA